MIRRMFSRRSFFGLPGSVPLAVPALVRAAAEPATAGTEVQAYPAAVAASYRAWQGFMARIRAREAVRATVDTSSLDGVIGRIGATKRVLDDLTSRTGNA